MGRAANSAGKGLGHFKTSEVGAVLKSTVKRIERQVRCRGLLQSDEDEVDPDVPDDPESNLAASAVSGRTQPAPPQAAVMNYGVVSGLAAIANGVAVQNQYIVRADPACFTYNHGP